MKISENGIKLIKQFEGCRLKSYKDSGGVWTIGWGHTAGVKEGMSWEQEEADRQLQLEAEGVGHNVNLYVNGSLTQNQFDAICDFVYNLGVGAFRGSLLLRRLNEGDWEAAGKEFLRWKYDNGVEMAGLAARRQSEKALFETKGNDHG